MKCPKCDADFETRTYGPKIVVQRCTGCHGLFCKPDVLMEMRREWMSDAVLDGGDSRKGKNHDQIGDINCPECNVKMDMVADDRQSHIWMESCPSCGGIYLDAGEFSDLKYETWMDKVRGLLKGRRNA